MSSHLTTHRQARGQTMVLFALTLMLLALMVCMTLSFGMKIREKIELQNVADTAAYSNAVATARVYNEVSILNRTQVSHMVAQSATQSLISWCSEYRSALGILWWGYLIQLAIDGVQCAQFIPCICCCIALWPLFNRWRKVNKEFTRIKGIWNGLDAAAGAQARWRFNTSMIMFAAEWLDYGLTLENGNISNQSLAKKVANHASGPWADVNVPSSGDKVSYREISTSLLCGTGNGAACKFNFIQDHATLAGMGSRGWTFDTGRWIQGQALIDAKLNSLGLGDPIIFQNAFGGFLPLIWAGGSGMWGFTNWTHSLLPAPWKAYGEDHGLLSYTYSGAGCAPMLPPLPAEAWVGGGNLLMGNVHQWWWEPWTWLGSDASPAIHSATTAGLPYPGVWPMFIDYEFGKVSNVQDNFGQPKNMSVIERNYKVRGLRADPWNLLFKYSFTPSGGQTFDNNGFQLAGPSFTGTDISQQVALGTGIAYYHRFGGHWKEPPNFFNPFWRATLVASDTDLQGAPAVAGGGNDPVNLLNTTGHPIWSDTYTQLTNRGFQGLQ